MTTKLNDHTQLMSLYAYLGFPHLYGVEYLFRAMMNSNSLPLPNLAARFLSNSRGSSTQYAEIEH